MTPMAALVAVGAVLGDAVKHFLVAGFARIRAFS